jgi:hypothetical protein
LVTVSIENGGPTQLRNAFLAGGLDKPVTVENLATEVARIEWLAPDHLEDIAKVADGEGGPAENGRQRGELQPGADMLNSVAQDVVVIKSEPPVGFGNRQPCR